MPRHITEYTPDLSRFDELVRSLAKELKAPAGGPQPLILEQVSKSPPACYVTVIWDRWKGVPDDIRPELVIAAYERAEGKEVSDSIMTAEAATAAEAVALGLLPFTITPVRRKNSPIPPEAYRKAIVEEAKKTVLGPRAGELRYARIDDAEAAYHRLLEHLPGSVWAITTEVPAPGE